MQVRNHFFVPPWPPTFQMHHSNIRWYRRQKPYLHRQNLQQQQIPSIQAQIPRKQVQIPRNAISSLSQIRRKCSIFLSQLEIVWSAAVNKAFHHSPAQTWLKSLSMTAIRSYSSTLTASFAFIRWPIQLGLMIEPDLSFWTHSRTSLITIDGSIVSSFTSMTRPK